MNLKKLASLKKRVGRINLGDTFDDFTDPADKLNATAPAESFDKSMKKDGRSDPFKPKNPKGRISMRTVDFQQEDFDKLNIGSQFVANRKDELAHANVYFTKKSADPDKKYDIVNQVTNPKAVLSFEEMELFEPLYKTLVKNCPEGPTAVQALVIPSVMEGPDDFVIRAPTGSGKTAAFLVPIINQIAMERKEQEKLSENFQKDRIKNRCISAIVICPNRDLAIQLTKDAMVLTKNTFVKVGYAIGEMSIGENVRTFKSGVDIVVGTLGRLNQFIFGENQLNAEQLRFFVADEADSLERLEGFVEFFEKIKAQVKTHCQYILSSATLGFETDLDLNAPVHIMIKDDMPPPTLVQGIVNIADIPKAILNDPDLPNRAPPKYCYLITFFNQHVCRVDSQRYKRVPKTIVYVAGKRKADSLAIHLLRCGFKVFSFHGDKTMEQRTTTIERMKNDEIDILIATNVLARGLNLNIDYVINYDLPANRSTYVEFVHRVGRTARVGNYGIALTLFDPHVDMGFAPYLRKMLVYYNMEVPNFLGDVINDYIEKTLRSHDGYIEQQLSAKERIVLNVANRGFLAGKTLNMTFA